MQRCDSCNSRIVLLGHVMVRRVIEHVVKHCLVLDRVTPLFPFQCDERKVWVKNRSQRIHEWHLSNTDSIEFGRQIEHAAHQQTACGPAHGCDSIGMYPSGSRNESGGIHKIGEGILFGKFLAVFIPTTPQFAASSHMGDYKDDAAI